MIQAGRCGREGLRGCMQYTVLSSRGNSSMESSVKRKGGLIYDRRSNYLTRCPCPLILNVGSIFEQ